MRQRKDAGLKISVIIPTYNYARFITEAIDSVIAQTFAPSEIIVVDDGSTDDTIAVLERIKDPRLKVLQLQRGGVGAAQNAGMKVATGKYVAFLDADDRWLPTKLERQVEIMEAEPDMVAIFCNFVRFRDDHVYPMDQFKYFPELATIPTQPTAAGKGRKIIGNGFSKLVGFTEVPAWVQTIMFRADALSTVSFHETLPGQSSRLPVFCEDMHFCLRVYRLGSVGFIEDSLVEVRRHGDNITKSVSEMPEAKLAALQMLGEDDLDANQRMALRRRVGRAQIEVGLQDIENGDITGAIRAYMQALGTPGARLSAIKNLVLVPHHSLKRRTAIRQSA